jgi:putative Mg2+ transporter-C (MgtC) family protein
VASNIVQGIGFLGAGLIIHNRSRVSGLASAAMVWVVASIGMACGAGLYAAAAVASLIVIGAMEVVGIFEFRASLKTYNLTYEARGSDQVRMLQSILNALDKAGERLSGVETNSIGDLQRVTFPLSAVRAKHQSVHDYLAAQPGISSLITFRDPEED